MKRNVGIRKVITGKTGKRVNMISINLKSNSVHLSHYIQIPNAIKRAYQGILRWRSFAAVKGESTESGQTVDIGG